MPTQLCGEQAIGQVPFSITWREATVLNLPEQDLHSAVASSTTLPNQYRAVCLIGKTFVGQSVAPRDSMNSEWHAMGQLSERPR
jgi:hypothetical protein